MPERSASRTKAYPSSSPSWKASSPQSRLSSSLDFELQREEDDQAVSLTGDEFREGYDAFRNKRAADFIAMPGVKA